MNFISCTIFRHSRHRHWDICRSVQSVWRNHSGKTLCPAMQEIVTHPAPPQHCFGSDVLRVGFQCREQVKVRWGKIGAVGRVIQSLPSKVMNLILCEPCCVWFCIFVQEHNTFIQEPWSLSLNGGPEFGEGVAVVCRIDGTMIEEIKQNHTFHIPKHCGHNLSCRGWHFEFFPHWWIGMLPCHWDGFGFWGKVVHPCLIACDDSEQGLISLSCVLH